MKTNYLFPDRFKKAGWIVFIPTAVLGLIWLITYYGDTLLVTKVFAIVSHEAVSSETDFFVLIPNDIVDEVLGILFIVSSILIAFSKEKNEDEYISQMRLESLVWATYLNYAILILAMLFVYNFAFFWVMVFNMFTILLFFIIRFNWVIYKSKKQVADEKLS
jgi:hypothetical protein